MKNKTKVTLSAVTIAISTLLMLKANAGEYPVKQVREGIYYHQGVQEDANRDNKGEIANTGFIIGEKCIAVVDTGGSYLEGKSLFAAIRDKSDLPICYVINTHAHPDHFFGNAAFKNTQAVFIGNDKIPAAIEARKTFYETRFSDILGEYYKGTEFIEPTRLVSVGEPLTIDLGGRELVLNSYPTSHTDNDLMDRRLTLCKTDSSPGWQY
jgi:glyoxylase-like metal-dependent hydrolase (beta-lactamase superfamily II)